MKKILFIVSLFFVPFLSNAQTIKPIDGFLGIKFGTSKADVITALKAKGGSLLGEAKENSVAFEGINLGNRKTVQVSVFFVENKAYLASLFFKAENDPETIDYYDDLVKDINEVYGTGKPYENFKSPYEKGDGHAVSALEGGYATIFTNWASDKASLQANINSHLYISLIYTDNALDAIAKAQEKAKQKADF